jgi:hypothetical protein
MSTTINQLTSSVLMGIAFVLPPVEERVEIGIFLADKVQRLNALLSDSIAAIALLQERRSALISAAVTGQIDVRALVPEASAA